LADYVKQAGGITDKYPNATPVETGEMYIKQYLVASETTHSANNSVTDSAASGTALSSGYKTNNAHVGISPDQKPHANLLELSQMAGKNTGLVVTYEWTNATPATFSSHVTARTDTFTIGEQIVNQGIDVVFGNTLNDYESKGWFADEYFKNRGYQVIRTKEQLNNIKAGDRVWGKLPQAYYDKDRAATTPNLAELTTAALRALDNGNKNGFFLMVEGSVIDGGGHASNALNMVSEWLAFDAACKVAIEFAKKRTDTIVVILPDHDTGGIKNGSTYTRESLESLVSDIQSGKNPSSITWEGNGGHTGRNGGIFMYVPEGVAYPEGIDVSKASQVLDEFSADFRTSTANRIDNTEIAPYLANFIGLDFDEVTDELFVDVTSRSTANISGTKFTFTNDVGVEVSVQKNTSHATVGGMGYDLDGQIVVQINGKLYVPRMLLTATPKESTLSIRADYNNKIVNISGKTGDASATVTMIATDPGVAVTDGNINPLAITYLKQMDSSYNGDYSLDFSISDAKIGDYNYYTKIAGEGARKDYTFSFRNLSVEKNGVAVEKMTQLNAGDSIDVVISGCDSNCDGYAFIGQYDENGSLITCDTIPVTGEAVMGTTLEESTETEVNTTIVSGADSIRAFYWSHGLVPFVGEYVVE